MPNRLLRNLQKHGLTWVLFAYIALCVTMGGAGREGHYWHGVAQAIAGLGIAALIVTWPGRIKLGDVKTPLGILTCIAVIGLLQTVPLSSTIWTSLPGRGLIADGYAQLGQASPALPISLDVEATLVTLGYVLTPIFILLLMTRIGMRRLRSALPWFVTLLAVFSVIFGLFQVYDGRDSALYFYEFTSKGLPVGFFSNVNHQASFLLMALPYPLFMLTTLGEDWQGGDSKLALTIVTVTLAFLILVGILGAGSVGGYAILAPVALLSLLASRKPEGKGMGRGAQFSLIAAFVIGAVLVGSSPVLEGIGVTSFSDGEGSRYSIWTITMQAIEQQWLTGTGLGTYESAIPMYEDPNTVNATFVAMAHNDYLQVVMEGGVAGLALLLFSLIWLGRTFLKTWSTKRSNATAMLRKFAFVSLIVVVLHSIVDYPARTPAIAAMIGTALALLTMPESQAARREPTNRDNEKRVVL